MYEIQQQQQQQQFKTTTKLLQTFPQEHLSYWITSLVQLNPNTLISSSAFSFNAIVIWTQSKCSKPLYEPIQRITRREVGEGIQRLVVLSQKKEEDEEEFASCSYYDISILIWRRGKGEFQIKQKIENVIGVQTLLYISLTNELIFGSDSYPSYLLQIWSPSSSSSSDFVKGQKIEISFPIMSLCQINRNDTKSRRIDFASGHEFGQIMIWSKQIANESNH